ncbi:hypothetical protein RND81_06G145800 [Saponaria officinalis]|uniref:Uncharacterized protein n=1 Tax=Saponaria officinalis TaxID=3572 RepID=A0AAW1KDC5_SAPOF
MEEQVEVDVVEERQDLVKVVQLLKEACQELQRKPSSSRSRNELIQLVDTITSDTNINININMPRVSEQLSSLKSLLDTLHATPAHSFVRRRLTAHQISRLASSIESDLQAWLDRQLVDSLLQSFNSSDSDSQLLLLMCQFQERLSQGFNLRLQELILKSNLFSQLETIVAHTCQSMAVREQAALCIEALISFNKNVFVVQLLMGPTTKSLISMATPCSFKVLSSLITSIKSPLVDEIHNSGLIPSILSFLTSSSSEMQLIALECVMQIGYYGRKDAVEAMLNAGVVEMLLHLQTSTCSGDDEDDDNDSSHPLGTCVADFAVQLEVGQGLRQREKRAFKHHILRRLRDANATLSHAQAATIQAQVLWGSFT